MTMHTQHTAPGSFSISADLLALMRLHTGSEAVQAYSSRFAQNKANCVVSMSSEHHHDCTDRRKDHRLQELKPN